MSGQGYATEEDAERALKLNEYKLRPGGVAWEKNGYRVQIVRDSWKAKYFIVPYK